MEGNVSGSARDADSGFSESADGGKARFFVSVGYKCALVAILIAVTMLHCKVCQGTYSYQNVLQDILSSHVLATCGFVFLGMSVTPSVVRKEPRKTIPVIVMLSVTGVIGLVSYGVMGVIFASGFMILWCSTVILVSSSIEHR